REIDTRVGADKAVMRLDDQRVAAGAHDAPALAQNDFHQPRVFAELAAELDGARRRLDIGEADDPPLGLGDYLVRDDENVAARERDVLARACLGDQRADRVPAARLIDAFNADDFQTAHDGPPVSFPSRGHRSRPGRRRWREIAAYPAARRYRARCAHSRRASAAGRGRPPGGRDT